MDRWITILEVSQKQAYIFGSKRVEDNIVNSAVIAKCLSPEYIKEVLASGYDDGANMVYSGGGHTILEFNDSEAARKCVFELTRTVYKEFDGLEVFAKTIKYDEAVSPKDNLKKLTAELEKKKAIRRSSFHHGSYGVEQVDVNTLKPKTDSDNESKKCVKSEEYNDAAKEFTPEGFSPTYKFEDLGGKKDESNFIAVVHIDGNGMGKRVEELYGTIGNSADWDNVKRSLREFSEGIDSDFKNAYKDMVEEVAESLRNGKLKDKLSLSGKSFPVRRIITAGDDICFVTEGRIGIECARVFIEKLSKKINKVDNKGYSACAGVAIVHQKYPFYRAYELAEMLCSSAKKAGAKLSESDDGRNVCSVDWHIEFGELKDSIDEIKKGYISDDGCVLSQRPYIITANKSVIDALPNEKMYSQFAKCVASVLSSEKELGDGKIKKLRSVMKKGANETENYVSFYKIKDKLNATFYEDKLTGEKVNPLFDAIEIMDTFLFI